MNLMDMLKRVGPMMGQGGMQPGQPGGKTSTDDIRRRMMLARMKSAQGMQPGMGGPRQAAPGGQGAPGQMTNLLKMLSARMGAGR